MRIENVEFQKFENIEEIFDVTIISFARESIAEIQDQVGSSYNSKFYEKIYSLVQKLDLIESFSKKQRIVVECLCITENVMRNMAEKYPHSIDNEIKNAISGARSNNVAKILNLNDIVKDLGSRNSTLIGDIENFEESSKQIRPKKKEIINYYHEKISTLNAKMVQKAELKIDINNMNSMICDHQRQLIRIEEDIMYMNEDITEEQDHHERKVHELVAKINELDNQIVEADHVYRVIKSESDDTFDAYLDSRNHFEMAEKEFDSISLTIQDLKVSNRKSNDEILQHKLTIDHLCAHFPVLDRKNKRKLEIHENKVQKHREMDEQLDQKIDSYKERNITLTMQLNAVEREQEKVIGRLTRSKGTIDRTKDKLDKLNLLLISKMEERSAAKKQITELEMALQHLEKTISARDRKSKTELKRMQHILNKELKEMRRIEHVKSTEEVKANMEKQKIREYQQQMRTEIKLFKNMYTEDKKQLENILNLYKKLQERLIMLESRLPVDKQNLCDFKIEIENDLENVKSTICQLDVTVEHNKEIIKERDSKVVLLLSELSDKQKYECQLKNSIIKQKREIRVLNCLIPEVSEDIDSNNRERESINGDMRKATNELMEHVTRQNEEILSMNNKLERDIIICNIVKNEKNKIKKGIVSLRKELEEFNDKIASDEKVCLKINENKLSQFEIIDEIRKETQILLNLYDNDLLNVQNNGETLQSHINNQKNHLNQFFYSFNKNNDNWSLARLRTNT